MEADFSGYATKNGLKCSDGRTIMPDAFKHNDQQKVPLVWQHQHNDSLNVLGHALLENRADGVYAYGFFNDTPAGENARALVKHGDITALSIYANNLIQQGKNVMHGDIRELSLVLSGANPGALIDNVYLRHGDNVSTVDDEAIIYTGLEFEHSDNQGEKMADANEKTVKEVFDSMSEEQKNVVYFMIGEALNGGDGEDVKHGEDLELDDDATVEEVFHSLTDQQKDVVYFMLGEALEGKGAVEHSNDNNSNTLQHNQEGNPMSRNVFEQNGSSNEQNVLSHAQIQTILTDAKKLGSMRESILAHAGEYGITDIDFLFPDAKTISNSPDFISRRMEWVSEVIGGTRKTPFARVKSVHADITADEARARGYIKGNLKKDEVIKLLRRTTDPTTIYKKQKLDRDDILDITELDVVAWLKAEMRLMIEEEIARAILFGDGRDAASEDKIDETRIRPIISDDDLYAHKVTLAANASVEDRVEALIRSRSNYKGSGQPVFFTTQAFLTDMLLTKDKVGRRVYSSINELAAALLTSKIIPVEAMEAYPNVVGVYVNLADYTIGANKGGELSMFDDFDIDYNQQKYLIETRISGALSKPKSAVVVLREAGIEVTPVSPSFDGATNTITFPATTGVIYEIDGVPVSGTKTITETTQVDAVPADGYSFPANTVTTWTFVYTA